MTSAPKDPCDGLEAGRRGLTPWSVCVGIAGQFETESLVKFTGIRTNWAATQEVPRDSILLSPPCDYNLKKQIRKRRKELSC
jgi:hypothetical protein